MKARRSAALLCLLAAASPALAEGRPRGAAGRPAQAPIVPVLGKVSMPDALAAVAASLPPPQQLEIACDKCASAEVVSLLYREALRVPFVSGEGVEADRRMVSVDIRGTQAELHKLASAYLEGLGYIDTETAGIHRISLPPPPKPPAPPPPPAKPRMTYSVYHTAWRDPSELGRMLSPLFPEGRFSAGGATEARSVGLPSSSIASAPTQGGSYGASSPSVSPSSGVQAAGGGSSGAADSLVFYGTVPDQTRLREILPQVDIPQAEVMVQAAVYEVDTTATSGSAFNIAVGLLKTQLSVGFGSSTFSPSIGSLATAAATGGGSALAGNFISFGGKNLEAVVGALASDQRFHVVTSPSVRARSGASTSFTVGQQVPVLGQVAYYGGQSSGPVQSVEYRSSGVIFAVRPLVRGNVIDLDLQQEVSSFVQTTTGVNNTPTLQQRQLSTSLSVKDGDVICLGGLTSTNNGKSDDGLPGFLSFIGSHQKNNTRTDLLLVLQVRKLNQLDGSATPDELTSRRQTPGPLPLPVKDAAQ